MPARTAITAMTAAAMIESLEFRRRRDVRSRLAPVVACVAAAVFPVVMAGCGGESDNPAVPTTLAQPTGTAPAVTVGAGVPLEPGSNLPPVEGDDETIPTSTG
jgi:hypothetical protein